MKQLILLLACLFSLSAFSAPAFSPLQREAVKFMIEDSGGRIDTQEFVDYLRMSHLLTKKELKRFPELLVHKDFHYVQIKLENCAHDIAIVVIDPEGKALNALYLDL